MKILLSTIGSRGDAQPVVALAVQLKALGQAVHLCVPPDFREWIEDLGLDVTPIGPELRKATGGTAPAGAARPSPERLRQLAQESVAEQFKTVAAAAQGCDVIVAATALQMAARSVAETLGIGYIFAAFCPAVLPSPHHPPPVYGVRGQTPAPADADMRELWSRDSASFNDTFGAPLNAHRATLGLPPVDDVRSHVFTSRPWLAADGTLGPWPDPADPGVFQTGAWILPDDRPLSAELEEFLAAGDPPVYFGFGSMRAPQGLSEVMVGSARAVGRRAIVSRGWAGLVLPDEGRDILAIDEVNQQALFKRVAAVVHHGGAGTTTAAAAAGTPQVIVPQMFDQHYWARRIAALGIGAAHAAEIPTVDSLTAALQTALGSAAAARARSVAGQVRLDGARVAAQAVIEAGQAR